MPTGPLSSPQIHRAPRLWSVAGDIREGGLPARHLLTNPRPYFHDSAKPVKAEATFPQHQTAQKRTKEDPMRIGPIARRSLLAAPLALFLAGSASADDVVYPPGSRIGLVPLQGIIALKSGLGFENPDNNLVVTFRELPLSEYEAIDAAVKDRKPL